MDFNTTANLLAGAAGRALGSVISKFCGLKNVGYNTFQKLFDTGVSPIIEYAAEVWGYKDFTQCERVHQRAFRYYLGVHPKTPILALMGDMGWLTSKERRQSKMVKYWNRLVHMSEERLTKKVFLYDYAICNNNWSSEMKSIFNATGMNNVFNDMSECDLQLYQVHNLKNLETRWKFGLPLKPKLRSYILYKDMYKTEEYVKYCMSRRKRSLMAQFRMGVLPLAIETGRFRGIALEDRICTLCSLNVIENEKHFLCECKMYSSLRNQVFGNLQSEMYCNSDLDGKFVYLMTYEWKLVADFLDSAWNLRSDKLFIHR